MGELLFEDGSDDRVEKMLLGTGGELHDLGDRVDQVVPAEVEDVEADVAVSSDEVFEFMAVAHDQSVVQLRPAKTVVFRSRGDIEGVAAFFSLFFEF